MRSPGFRLLLAGFPVVLVGGCGGDPEPDAYGNFEATEIVVSAQTTGQIQAFIPVEGIRLAAGDLVAVIDTTQLVLEQRQLAAVEAAGGARGVEVGEELKVLEVQQEIALRTYERTRRLHAQQAATATQLDAAEREYRALTARIGAVRAQRRSVGLEVTSTVARIDQIRDRLEKSRVTNPRAGVVLTTYARAGEVVQAGQPLYRIADLDTLELRAYFSGDQLGSVVIGRRVDVRIDRGDGLTVIPGTISWISPSAEFTPTPIQTRQERTSLVYAVKIRVANPDGLLKIGMPADVTLGSAGEAGR